MAQKPNESGEDAQRRARDRLLDRKPAANEPPEPLDEKSLEAVMRECPL
jgi:hypothetical protein